MTALLNWTDTKRTLASLALIAAGSALLALQGWGGRLTGFDLVPHAREAALFLKTGLIPTHGCLSSMGSYIPPGTSWLIVPGQLLFADPRLETVPGALLLHLAAIAGVYALARWCWTRSVGLWAALLFAFSPTALKMAVGLWPRFPMAASVWFAFFMARWAYDRKPACLAAALLVLVLGLYVHMEGLLLVGVIPLVWILFRPPVFSRWLLVAVGLGFLIWLPYLAFERDRHYVDLKSQVDVQTLFYTPDTLARVNAMAVKHGLPQLDLPQTGAVERRLPWKARVLDAGNTLALRIAGAFQSLGTPFSPYGLGNAVALTASMALLLFLLATLLPALHPLSVFIDKWVALPLDFRGRDKARHFTLEGHAPSWPSLVGILTLLAACCANEWVLAKMVSSHGHMEDYTKNTIRLFQGVLACAGCVLIFRRSITAIFFLGVNRPLSRATPLAVLLLAVWGAMAWLVGSSIPYRFWFLWPLQVVSLAGLVIAASQALTRWFSPRPDADLGSHRPRERLVRSAAVATLVVLTFYSPPLRDRLKSWNCAGWQGASGDVAALQLLAQTIKREGLSSASIGYQMTFSPFMAYFRAIDQGYKVGSDYDWYLEAAHGIRNINTSPSGLSEEDQFRLVVSGSPSGNQLGPLSASTAGWSHLGTCGACMVMQKDK